MPSLSYLERVTGLRKKELFERTYAQLKTTRSSWEGDWQALDEMFCPGRLRLNSTDSHRRQRKDLKILDATPRLSLRTLQFGLHAGVTSPARPWFKLTTPDPTLAEVPDVKRWLQEVTDRILNIFLRSNIYQTLPQLYGDMAVFSTAGAGILEDPKDLLRSYEYPVGSYVFGLDERNKPCVFAREYRLTVRQLLKQFGGPKGAPLQLNDPKIHWENFSNTVKSLYTNNALEQPVEVCWYVAPNDGYNPEALYAGERLPYSSCYFEKGNNKAADFTNRSGFLRESGFREFPILLPRWDALGEDPYGWDSPGYTALGDTRSLQFQERKKAKAIDKAVDPPLKAVPSVAAQKTSLNPGDMTYVDERDVNKGLAPIHEVRLEGLQHIVLDMNQRQNRIDRIFYADLFLLLHSQDMLGQPNPQKTAREIEERHEEKLLALGPVLERLNDELLEVLIDRAFDILVEAGAIPPAPRQLQGLPLKIEFISIMAQAQKLAGIATQDRFITSILGMAQQAAASNLVFIAEELAAKVHWQQTVDSYADKLGIDQKLLRSDEEANALLQEQRAAHAQAMQAATLKDQAAAAQSLGQTPTQGGTSTALEDMAVVAQRNAAGGGQVAA